MPETQTVYKVVRRTKRGVLFSAIIRNKQIRLRYREGQVTESPNGRRPFAFSTLRQATGFRTGYQIDIRQGRTPYEYFPEVWEAEATDVRPAPVVSCGWDSLAKVKEFWKNVKDIVGHRAGTVWVGDAPEGTVSCQTIKLVRKVA